MATHGPKVIGRSKNGSFKTVQLIHDLANPTSAESAVILRRETNRHPGEWTGSYTQGRLTARQSPSPAPSRLQAGRTQAAASPLRRRAPCSSSTGTSFPPGSGPTVSPRVPPGPRVRRSPRRAQRGTRPGLTPTEPPRELSQAVRPGNTELVHEHRQQLPNPNDGIPVVCTRSLIKPGGSLRTGAPPAIPHPPLTQRERPPFPVSGCLGPQRSPRKPGAAPTEVWRSRPVGEREETNSDRALRCPTTLSPALRREHQQTPVSVSQAFRNIELPQEVRSFLGPERDCFRSFAAVPKEGN